MLLNIKSLLKLSTNVSEIFIILRRIYRRIFINILRSLCKVPRFVRFATKLNFLDIYSRNRYIQFKENPPYRSNCTMLTDGRIHRQTDRQTEITKFIVVIRNFTNVSKSPQHIAYVASVLEDSLCLVDCINLRKCLRLPTFIYTRLSFQFLKGFLLEFSLNTTPLATRLSLRGFHPIDFVKQERMAELCYKEVVLTLPAYCGYMLYISKPLSNPRDNFET